MTEANSPAPTADQGAPATPPPPPTPVSAPSVPAYAGAPGAAPIGKIRSTGTCILLAVVTLGLYTWYWYYQTHTEMKQHSGAGVGGGLALILAIFVGIAMVFVTPGEVGNLYARRGQEKPVSASTGLWALLLGWFFFVGLIVWFVKTNGALNDYWRSLGAEG